MKSLTVSAKAECLDEINAFLEGELEAYDCPMKTQMQIEVAVEEIFINIASYAYHPVEGEAEIRCEVLRDPLRVVIQLLDSGRPYDPLAKEDADTSEEAIMAREGGLGILMVKKTMDDVKYSYENGKNVLTIQKNL